jgi:hypothetical protein
MTGEYRETALSQTDAAVGSFGEALRRIPPHAFPEASDQVQRVVAAALHWFTVTAPILSATHCIDLRSSPVPDVLLVLPEVTVDRALNPATFRTHVQRLRHAVEVRERPAREAYNNLVRDDKSQIYGLSEHGQSQVTIHRDLLGSLLGDMVYARSWLDTYGTKAGYWSYRFIGDCLTIAAIDSLASRAALAEALRADADNALHDYFDTEPSEISDAVGQLLMGQAGAR